MGDIKKGFWNTWLGKKLSSFGSWISDKTSSFWNCVKNWWNGDNNTNTRNANAPSNQDQSQSTETVLTPSQTPNKPAHGQANGKQTADQESYSAGVEGNGVEGLELIVEHIYNQIKPIVEPQKCDKDFVINELRKTVSNYYSLNKIPMPVVKNMKDCKKFNISKNRISLPVARLHGAKEVMNIPIHIPTTREQEVESPTVDTAPNEKLQPTAMSSETEEQRQEAVKETVEGLLSKVEIEVMESPDLSLNPLASTSSSSRRNSV